MLNSIKTLKRNFKATFNAIFYFNFLDDNKKFHFYDRFYVKL